MGRIRRTSVSFPRGTFHSGDLWNFHIRDETGGCEGAGGGLKTTELIEIKREKWWRRWELNPRPKIQTYGVYMLVLSIDVA